MSSAGDAELKGGHPPAVKAGGMRVARHRTNSQGDNKETAKPTQEEQEEYGTSPPKADTKHAQSLLVSGAMTQGDKDFTPAAVKQYHDKPIPAKEKRPMNQSHNIQQPR